MPPVSSAKRKRSGGPSFLVILGGVLGCVAVVAGIAVAVQMMSGAKPAGPPRVPEVTAPALAAPGVSAVAAGEPTHAAPGAGASASGVQMTPVALPSASGATRVRPPLPPSPDPLFDLHAILNDPLDAKVTKTSEQEGLVTEEFEYTAFVTAGHADRVQGVLVYPKAASAAGTKLPGVFWSQGGLTGADRGFPTIFARKGYLGMSIGVPNARRNSFGGFDAAHPEHGNFTLMAIDQMRAITYMTQRPEVDADRIIVAGSSYGGFFAALLAGADPRVIGGMSYFAAGRQDLGCNLMQYMRMATPADAAVWARLIDPAVRLRSRAVPFLFTCAANDSWFFPPGVVQTFAEAPGDCRLAIVPHWQQAYPESMDNQIIDYADVLTGSGRAPYNKPSALSVEARGGKLIAKWSWTGKNPVKRAELVVSYGVVRNWQFWCYRHHEVMPAMITGNTATAELPVPFAGAVAYVYGNITDDHDVLTSTVPQTIDAAKLGGTVLRPDLKVNCVPYGDFEAEAITFLTRSGAPCGTPDKAVKHGGEQSIRFDPLPPGRAGAPSLLFKLDWVPELPHKLTVWVRSARPAHIWMQVQGVAPAAWATPLGLALARQERAQAATPVRLPTYEATTVVGTAWKRVEIDVPAPKVDLDGYNLRVSGDAGQKAPFWMDDLSFEPVWPGA